MSWGHRAAAPNQDMQATASSVRSCLGWPLPSFFHVFGYHIRMLSGVLRGESPAVDTRPALSTSDSIWLD